MKKAFKNETESECSSTKKDLIVDLTELLIHKMKESDRLDQLKSNESNLENVNLFRKSFKSR